MGIPTTHTIDEPPGILQREALCIKDFTTHSSERPNVNARVKRLTRYFYFSVTKIKFNFTVNRQKGGLDRGLIVNTLFGVATYVIGQ